MRRLAGDGVERHEEGEEVRLARQSRFRHAFEHDRFEDGELNGRVGDEVPVAFGAGRGSVERVRVRGGPDGGARRRVREGSGGGVRLVRVEEVEEVVRAVVVCWTSLAVGLR